MNNIYKTIEQNKNLGKKGFAVLIDPDATHDAALEKTIRECNDSKVDFVFVGGSIITNGFFEQCITTIKNISSVPCVIFPGNTLQISSKADAVLFLTLISGRNPEFLIGNHVLTAPLLKQSGLEIMPTGYMLIDGGRLTSVSYMSNTIPIPSDKYPIAVSTAMAGEMLGLKIIYMDAGSGALQPVPVKLISSVRAQISVPMIIGGGIRTEQNAVDACLAGADIVVAGNAVEKDPGLIKSLAEAVHGL